MINGELGKPYKGILVSPFYSWLVQSLAGGFLYVK